MTIFSFNLLKNCSNSLWERYHLMRIPRFITDQFVWYETAYENYAAIKCKLTLSAERKIRK